MLVLTSDERGFRVPSTASHDVNAGQRVVYSPQPAEKGCRVVFAINTSLNGIVSPTTTPTHRTSCTRTVSTTFEPK